jgi:flagellar protein FlaG
MGLPISTVGRSPAIQQELPQENALSRVAQVESRAGLLKRAAPSLSGQGEAQKSLADIRSTALDLEQITLAFNKKLKFTVDHQSHEVTVKVIDPETDKVIKVLPPEELQRMHSQIKETIGFLFDERV